jgi:hypothetical protein
MREPVRADYDESVRPVRRFSLHACRPSACAATSRPPSSACAPDCTAVRHPAAGVQRKTVRAVSRSRRRRSAAKLGWRSAGTQRSREVSTSVSLRRRAPAPRPRDRPQAPARLTAPRFVTLRQACNERATGAPFFVARLPQGDEPRCSQARRRLRAVSRSACAPDCTAVRHPAAGVQRKTAHRSHAFVVVSPHGRNSHATLPLRIGAGCGSPCGLTTTKACDRCAVFRCTPLS